MNTVLGMIAIIYMDGTFEILSREFLNMEECVRIAFSDAAVWRVNPLIADTLAVCEYLGVDA